MKTPRAPLAITRAVRSFCKKVATGSKPIYLDTRPVAGARIDDCFAVVDQQVAERGGERVLGWQVWQHGEVMIEAEFHAVWRDPAGVLRDIAPKPDGISRILFLRDPSRRYESRQVNNIREALWDSLEVHELIAAANARFEFMDRGERAHQHGKIALRGRERDEWLALQDRWETATVNLQEAIAAGHRPPAAATRQPAQLDLIDRNAKKRARRAQR